MIRALFLLLFSCEVCAQEPDTAMSFRFRDVRVSDLIQVTYTDILQKSFVLDNTLTHATDSITLDLSRITAQQFDKQLRLLLDNMGYQVQDVDGIAFFSKKKEGAAESADAFVYRPVHRSVTYLSDLVGAVFNRNAFSTQRGTALPDGAGFGYPQDSGINALSMTNKQDADVPTGH